MKSKSCVGCMWLIAKDEGYSNWTVLNTDIHCLKGNNNQLPAEEPYDWTKDAEHDNWPPTKDGRCELYCPDPCLMHGCDMVHLDCDEEGKATDQTSNHAVLSEIKRQFSRD